MFSGVVDVSESNDWTAVRVSLGRSGLISGSVYPTYGFIYDRPDSGTMLTADHRAGRFQPALNAAPHDLRPLPERTAVTAADTLNARESTSGGSPVAFAADAETTHSKSAVAT